MTQSQLEQIKEFHKDFSIVQTLKTDLDSYNDQLNKLLSDLTSKSEECSNINQANTELDLKLESFKKQNLQLEDQLATELDYKKMYAELKLEVDGFVPTQC
jgi:predicted  nucleic acid-binding Zn-ribbon protein